MRRTPTTKVLWTSAVAGTVIALGGAGAAMASASTPGSAGTPSSVQSGATKTGSLPVDTPTAGDIPDGAKDKETADSTKDKETADGTKDTDNLQQGDQSGPEKPDTAGND